MAVVTVQGDKGLDQPSRSGQIPATAYSEGTPMNKYTLLLK